MCFDDDWVDMVQGILRQFIAIDTGVLWDVIGLFCFW